MGIVQSKLLILFLKMWNHFFLLNLQKEKRNELEMLPHKMMRTGFKLRALTSFTRVFHWYATERWRGHFFQQSSVDKFAYHRSKQLNLFCFDSSAYSVSWTTILNLFRLERRCNCEDLYVNQTTHCVVGYLSKHKYVFSHKIDI